jgi:hypothetical protein
MLSTRVPKIAQTKIYVLRLRGLSKKEKLLFFINSYQAVSAFVYVYEKIKRGMFNLIPLLPKQNIDFQTIFPHCRDNCQLDPSIFFHLQQTATLNFISSEGEF